MTERGKGIQEDVSLTCVVMDEGFVGSSASICGSVCPTKKTLQNTKKNRARPEKGRLRWRGGGGGARSRNKKSEKINNK